MNPNDRPFDSFFAPISRVPITQVDMDQEFFCCVPIGTSQLSSCPIFQLKEQAEAWAEQQVREGTYTRVNVMKLVSCFEEEKKPVVKKEF